MSLFKNLPPEEKEAKLFAIWLGSNGYTFHRHHPGPNKWKASHAGKMHGYSWHELDDLWKFYKAGGRGRPEPNKTY